MAIVVVTKSAQVVSGRGYLLQRSRIRSTPAESDAQRGGGCDGQSGYEPTTLQELEPGNGHLFTNPWLEASSTL